MEIETTKLIDQLAEKLGTTAEYLWSVLLKQAPIDATITLIQFLCIIVFGLLLYKSHKYLMKKEDNGKYSENGYDKYVEIIVPIMIIGSFLFVILFVLFFCCIEDIINGYFNPEYWAISKILKNIK